MTIERRWALVPTSTKTDFGTVPLAFIEVFGSTASRGMSDSARARLVELHASWRLSCEVLESMKRAR